MSSGVCGLLPVCPASIGSGLASDVAGAVIGAIGAGLVQSAGWLLTMAADSTEPGLTNPSFTSEFHLMQEVGLLVVLPVLCVATIGPVLRQDARRLLRVWAIGLPVALLAGLATAQLTAMALEVTDFMCAVVTSGSGSISGGLDHLVSAQSLASAPTFVQMALAVLISTGALMVWLELMVRSAGVYVATFFMPVALVAFIWPATAGVARRAVEILVALVMSKFVIIASLSLGLAAISGHGINSVVSGCGIVLIAAFSPFVLFRLTTVVDASAIAHVEGMSRRPLAAASGLAAAPGHPVVATVMRAASSGGGAAGGGGAGLGVAEALTPRVPEAPADYPVGGVGRSDA